MINIYKIINLKNNKVYIGQTINSIQHRFNQHLRETRSNNELHRDMQSQNKKDFKVILLDTAENMIDADEKERFWISFYDSTNKNKGYNLDSGGRSNCKKSETALRPMKEAVMRNWENEDKAKRMLDGLEKGIDTWKEICRNKRVEFVCPVCGEKLYLPKHELKNRNTCGKEYCKNKYARIHETYKKGIIEANKTNKIKNEEKSNHIKEFVLTWVNNNKDIVLNCPKNKITTTLSDLINNVEKEFRIKDIRSISYNCCKSNSKIKFLTWLKENIS